MSCISPCDIYLASGGILDWHNYIDYQWIRPHTQLANDAYIVSKMNCILFSYHYHRTNHFVQEFQYYTSLDAVSESCVAVKAAPCEKRRYAKRPIGGVKLK
jgi:hypothetical protein